MAQIVTITNPLTGQPAQVDQLEHTAQQIDDSIGRALPGGEIDTLLSGKAPAGYGLGTSAVAIDDYNNAVNNGWYRGGANYPSKINYAHYGMVRVDSIGQIKLQTFYAGDTGGAMTAPFMAIRKSSDSGATWSEWEYVNPPMIFGEEYRTTERYNGKPVYKVALETGALIIPGNTSVNGTWDTNCTVIGVDAYIHRADGSVSNLPNFETASDMYARCWARKVGQFVVKSYTGLPSGATVKAEIRYIKN